MALRAQGGLCTMMAIWTWLKNNFGTITNVAIFVIGVVIIFFDMTGRASPEAIQGATLTLLTLIGASLLTSHATNSRLQQEVEEILLDLKKPSAGLVLAPYKERMQEMERRLGLAREVWILSRTCIRIWDDYSSQFIELLSEGGGLVRLMLVDPDDGAGRMIVESAEGWEYTQDVNLWRANVNNLLTRLAGAHSRFELESERLQVRLINYLPAWTLVLIDPESDKGVIFVELATFSANSRSRPAFLLTAEEDPQLFKLFREEFETMWKRARSADTVYERDT
jgi:hypothetical protein